MEMTDWQEKYESGETPWDKGYAAPPLGELGERIGLAVFGAGTVLVPGCGSGHDVRWLANQGQRAHGIDLAAGAIHRAQAHPPVALASYELADFLDPSWRAPVGTTGIWEHTLFCAIDPADRRAYGASAARHLAPGQVLAGVFFLTPHDPGSDAEGPPFATTIDEIDHAFSPWFHRARGWVPQAAYEGRRGREWMAVMVRSDHSA